jgi:hypothetical protein
MRILYLAAAAVVFLCSAVQAEEQSNTPANAPANDQMAVGVGIICNTSEQVERYADLRADGAELTGAVNVVNGEAKDPRACGVAAVAFMPDKKVETKSARGKLVSIMRINIVATFDGAQWSTVPGMVQYTLIETEGYEI